MLQEPWMTVLLLFTVYACGWAEPSSPLMSNLRSLIYWWQVFSGWPWTGPSPNTNESLNSRARGSALEPRREDTLPLFCSWTRGSWWSLWDYLPCRLSSCPGSYSSVSTHCPMSQEGAMVMPQVWWSLWPWVVGLWPHPTERISWGFGLSAPMIPFTGDNDGGLTMLGKGEGREKSQTKTSPI